MACAWSPPSHSACYWTTYHNISTSEHLTNLFKRSKYLVGCEEGQHGGDHESSRATGTASDVRMQGGSHGQVVLRRRQRPDRAAGSCARPRQGCRGKQTPARRE